MSKTQALQEFNQELHISYSQVFCFSTCPLKHMFQYKTKRPPERVSIALSFGSAIHSALEMYYLSLQKHGHEEPIEALCERFETCLELDLRSYEIPIIFKKDLPDHKGLLRWDSAS